MSAVSQLSRAWSTIGGIAVGISFRCGLKLEIWVGVILLPPGHTKVKNNPGQGRVNLIRWHGGKGFQKWSLFVLGYIFNKCNAPFSIV